MEQQTSHLINDYSKSCKKTIKQKKSKKSDETYENVDNSSFIYLNLEKIFEDLDLTAFPNVSPGASLDALANYVIENPQLFKKKVLNKVIEEDTLEPTLVNLVNNSMFNNGSLLSAFMENFHEFFEIKTSYNKKIVFNKKITYQLLLQNFPRCRTVLIEHLLDEFNGRYSTAALICLFVESELSHLVRKYFFHIEETKWNEMVLLMPSQRKRRKTWIDVPNNGEIRNSFDEFERFIQDAKKSFPELFNANLISKNAENLILEKKKFQCGVCFDDFPRNSAISCSFPEYIDLSLTRQNPSTSDNSKRPHLFCLECIRGQALAATTDTPLAEGGIGLKCMAIDCKNPILFSRCRSLIPYRIRKLLNERIVEETLGAANLQNLERCKRCSYAIEIEIPKTINKIFFCFKCKYEFCRICERTWNSKHFGKKCEELDGEESVDRELYLLQKKMNEILIRKCHKCGLPFVKRDGCNRVHCRCGAVQCYVCRAPNIKYTHFCQHFFEPNQKGCNKCKKKCLLWQNVDSEIDVEIEKIKKNGEENGIFF